MNQTFRFSVGVLGACWLYACAAEHRGSASLGEQPGDAGSSGSAGQRNATGGASDIDASIDDASSGGDAGSPPDTDASAGAGASGGGPTDAGPDAEPPLTKPPFDWVGVIGTGQSLSVGATAGFISPSQPFKNLRLLDSGPDPKYPLSGGEPKWSLIPLTEPVRAHVAGAGPGYSDGQYPNNISGETPHSGMANTLSRLWLDRGGAGDYISVHSVVGWSGHKLVDIDKVGGKRAYPASLSEARATLALAKQKKKSFGYGGVIMTHGESDATTPDYGAGLYRLWQDYNADLKSITGQKRDIVMLVSQQSTKASGSDGSAAQVLRVSKEHPRRIICTGPKYQYLYSGDKLHLPAAGYRRLGEKYAEIFDLVVNQGLAWQPLAPTGVSRTGKLIKVDFHVPNPPLVWSEHIAPPHQTEHAEWKAGRGFEVTTSTGTSLVIASVAIEGSSVLVTLKDTPPADSKLVVAYAMTQDGTGNQGGTVLGLRGLLRDSDAFVGDDAETISASVKQGSRIITSTTAGAFRRRTGYDIVSISGVPNGLVVTSRDSDDQLTLSAPWPSASGTVNVSFRYDQYNYAVHFSLPVN